MKFHSTVSTAYPFDLTNRSLNIGIDINTDIDLNTIANIYVIIDIYTNHIVIPTASTSTTSTIATITFTNPDLKYANSKFSLHKLQELEFRMITTYNSRLLQSNAVLCLPSYLQSFNLATMTIHYM